GRKSALACRYSLVGARTSAHVRRRLSAVAVRRSQARASVARPTARTSAPTPPDGGEASASMCVGRCLGADAAPSTAAPDMTDLDSPTPSVAPALAFDVVARHGDA